MALPPTSRSVLAPVRDLALHSPSLQAVVASVGEQELHVASVDAAWPWVISALATRKPVLAVTATGREAQDLAAELRGICDNPSDVLLFPGWETLPHERLSPGVETVGTRMAVLHALSARTAEPVCTEPLIVVAPVRAFIQPIMAEVKHQPIVLAEGEDIEGIALTLVRMGYKHVDLVGKRGEFAVRGSVIDIYPTTEEQPVRLELWGDEITDLRWFSTGDQRTVTDADGNELGPEQVEVFPCREFLLTEEIMARAGELAAAHSSNAQLANVLTKLSEGMPVDGMESLIPVLYRGQMRTLPEWMPAGTHIVVVSPHKVRRRAEDLLVTEREFLRAGWEAAAAGAQGPMDAAAIAARTGDEPTSTISYRSVDGMRALADRLGAAWWTLTPPGFDTLSPEVTSGASSADSQGWTDGSAGMNPDDPALTHTIELSAVPAARPLGKPAEVAAATRELRDALAAGAIGVYAALTPAAVARAVARFAEDEVPVRLFDPAGDMATTTMKGRKLKPVNREDAFQPGTLTVVRAALHAGVIFGAGVGTTPGADDLAGGDAGDAAAAVARDTTNPGGAGPAAGTHDTTNRGTAGTHPLVILAETDFTGNRVAPYGDGRRKPARKRNRVDPLALEAGDFVVHETHGIGRFVKLEERTVGTGANATRREYVVLEYAPSKRGGNPDQLYVPMTSLDLLSRYVGGEAPSLSKMGGSDWRQTKHKARAAVRDIAADLVQLYAKRRSAPGFAFSPDTPWQREMEDAFPYTETEDQYNAIEAVKADMERPVPMDRVIVGDVGYGKTEVAVRAAFKAVQDGKQVAVLVPTTLLVQQHTATFRARMEGYPVTIRELSRFTTPKESKEIIEGMADGKVDIVIGTHRLLQTGVQWKNLGLVIVDEEQRFGVEHKEHIKALRTHVDVLTMSATPIPRTLEMSMAGIRDMSTIMTPPQDRLPVLTYVGVQDDKQIAAAIRRELLRDGQVFYVHNKVRTIEEAAQHVRTLVPEARVVVAHGQMSEDQLERTVQGFWAREYDVLVCTTIVETGLDISNANTLIVENAQNMGLSQLHQLRGRVGRSRERGYAYFLYPRDRTLTETSYDRLSTIATHSDLGAGMAVAMKDLEMRGAGNVLGAEQSGHIAGVGFDLYMRLVGEAVEAFKAMADGQPIDGTDKEKKESRIELAIDAHIPPSYISSERLRLAAYRDIAQAGSDEALGHVRDELKDRYGEPPMEIDRLMMVARLRLVCQKVGVTDVVATGAAGASISFSPLDLPDSKRVRLARLFPRAQYRAATHQVVIPAPRRGRGLGAEQVTGEELLQWCANVLTTLCEVPGHDVRHGGELSVEDVQEGFGGLNPRPSGAAGAGRDAAGRGSGAGSTRSGSRGAGAGSTRSGSRGGGSVRGSYRSGGSDTVRGSSSAARGEGAGGFRSRSLPPRRRLR